MYDVWVLDFISNTLLFFRAGMSRKKATRLMKRWNRMDKNSVALLLPTGFNPLDF
jgi:hypothetical protein